MRNYGSEHTLYLFTYVQGLVELLQQGMMANLFIEYNEIATVGSFCHRDLALPTEVGSDGTQSMPGLDNANAQLKAFK